VFAASPASAGIVGKDDRLSYIPESFAKAEPAIGIVRTYQGGCTGFCVAENIVATSAHCLIEKHGGWRQLDLRIRFSNFSGKNRLTRYVSGSGTAARRLNVVLGTQDRRHKAKKWLSPHVNDWALLRVDHGACPATLALGTARNLPKATRRARTGMASILYRKDKPSKTGDPSVLFSPKCRFSWGMPGFPRRYQKAFRRMGRGKPRAVHTCDGEKGQSGSPIMRIAPKGRLEVLGVYSGYGSFCVNAKKKLGCVPFGVAAKVTTLAKALNRFQTETVVGPGEVRRIQKALAKRKLFKGFADGIFTQETRAAIRKFERRAKMVHLGLPTVKLMRKLRLIGKYEPYPAPVPRPKPNTAAPFVAEKKEQPDPAPAPKQKPTPAEPATAQKLPGSRMVIASKGVVIGKDNRRFAMPPRFKPARSALGVVRAGNHACSAFCVADNIIATSADCVVRDDGEWRQKNAYFSFWQRSGRDEKSRIVKGYSNQARALNIVLGKRVPGLRRPDPWRHQNDWALMRIDGGACRSSLPLISARWLMNATKGKAVGMASAVNRPAAGNTRLAWRSSADCRFSWGIPGLNTQAKRGLARVAGRADLVTHDCDSEGGQSGSPILQILEGGKLGVVAVHSGSIGWRLEGNGTSRTVFANTAAPALGIAKSLARFQKEKVVGSDDIARIQLALARRHYHRGRRDGIFDQETRRSILWFERQKKMARLGLPTNALMAELRLRPKTPRSAAGAGQKRPQSAQGRLITGLKSVIVGRDDRSAQLPPAYAAVAGATGMLVHEKGYCNAFCVAPNIVATSASCVIDDYGRWTNWPNFTNFVRFADGRKIETPLAGHGFEARQGNIALGRLRRQDVFTRPRRNRNDWALLKLAKPACKTVLDVRATQGASASNPKEPLGVLSSLRWNAADRNNGTMSAVVSGNCATLPAIPGIGASPTNKLKRLAAQTGLLFHTCDAAEHQVGSPILRLAQNGRAALVGIHSGHAEWRTRANETAGRRQAVNAGVRLAAFAPSLARFRRERSAASNQIKWIQGILATRKFYKGPVNGRFDMRLRRAILKYEEQARLPRLGLPTFSLMQKLTESLRP
ncbi:MAG: peptidoglycan-binding protein, partial [Pseudomonadota bacterium]